MANQTSAIQRGQITGTKINLAKETYRIIQNKDCIAREIKNA